MSWRNLLGLFKIAKETPEIPEITEALKNSSTFRRIVKKVEFTKLKGIQLLDEAAFPENYTKDKLLEHKKNSNAPNSNENLKK